MIISITDAARETAIAAFGFGLAMLVSARRSKNSSLFSLETTNELKGLAILMIVASHIGYFLVSDNQFLQPFSHYAGVGVDLFLVLSGYGLTVSALQKSRTVGQFYLRRLPRIYLPMIITLLTFLLLDGLVLHQTYPIKTTIENLLGIFPKANLYVHIDSPLWYITFLLVFYLTFPIIFRRRFILLSAAAMALAVWLFILYIPQLNLISPDLLAFYKLHFLAFPLGMALAALLGRTHNLIKTAAKKISSEFHYAHILLLVRFAALVLASIILVYTYQHSHVGEEWFQEAAASLATATALIIIFIIKRIDFKILGLLGAFSFEIYLLHWPLLWRYNFVYGRLPAGAATLIYLGIFVGLGYLFKGVVDKILNAWYWKKDHAKPTQIIQEASTVENK